jgi:iron complex transport system substrate-binding protein
MSQAEIDSAVAERLAAGHSLYDVDERLLDSLAPDVIVTQDLCQVCAPSGTELSRALRMMERPPEVLYLTPHTLADIEDNIRDVGRMAGRESEAEQLIESNRVRVDRVRRATEHAPVRRVAFLEWTEPVFSAGHWVPEMVTLAGGHDALGQRGGDSQRISWSDVVASAPEIIVVSPCGYRLDQAVELARRLPPVEGARIVAVDANSYFARPGARTAEAIELLAQLFHPGLVSWDGEGRPWAEID